MTNFETSNNEDFVNKAYLDTELSKVEGHISFIEKDYNELQSDKKQPYEEVLIERAVKKTRQVLCDKGLFDNFDNAGEVLKDHLLIEVKEKKS